MSDSRQLLNIAIYTPLRSSPFSGNDNVTASGENNVTVVNSPKSGVNFFSLGDFKLDMEKAANRAKPQLDILRKGNTVKAKPSEKMRMVGV